MHSSGVTALYSPRSSDRAAEGQPPAVECRGVVKRFFHYEHRTTTLQEFFVRSVLRKPIHVRHAYFQLRDFTLRVERGESVALVGPNGSGKSTALRLIAGIYPVTEGAIVRNGRVVAVIELGGTFHNDLTGAENLELYAAALGLTGRQIAERTPEILRFADLAEFIDVPVKYYSSGMRTRLAFAVAVCSDPDTLLLDEVLAVGDETFRQRCLNRLRELHAERRTLIIVSHDIPTLREFCTRAVWLDHGAVRMSGDIDRVLDAYQAEMQGAV